MKTSSAPGPFQVNSTQVRYKLSHDRKKVFVIVRENDFAVVDDPNVFTLRLQCFDAKTGRSLWSYKIEKPFREVRSASLSPNDKLVSLLYLFYENGVAHQIGEIRSTATGELLRRFISAPTANSTLYIAHQFSPDNKTLLVPCDDRLELWDVSNIR